LIACTSNLWSPVSSFLYVIGDSQAVNGRPSSEHWSLVPGTSEAKVKVAVELSLTASGPDRIIARGGAP
jgi:hypothetical protein